MSGLSLRGMTLSKKRLLLRGVQIEVTHIGSGLSSRSRSTRLTVFIHLDKKHPSWQLPSGSSAQDPTHQGNLRR